MSETIHIVGAGAWGTALAYMMGRAGHQVLLYTNTPDVPDYVQAHNVHPLFPQVPWPASVHVTMDPRSFAQATTVLSVVPVQVTAQALSALGIPEDTPIVLCSKGLDQSTQWVLSDAVRAKGAWPLAVLSGPSFASDVAHGLPTSVVLASEEPSLVDRLLPLFQDPAFKVIPSADMLGVQLAGALKNVIALASGMLIGGGYGENIRAALITQALEELSRLGESLGASLQTFYGLAGLGDTLLSATSTQSRNFSLGLAMGAASKTSHADQPLAEGLYTVQSLQAVIQRSGQSFPFLSALGQMILGITPLEASVQHLQR